MGSAVLAPLLTRKLYVGLILLLVSVSIIYLVSFPSTEPSSSWVPTLHDLTPEPSIKTVPSTSSTELVSSKPTAEAFPSVEDEDESLAQETENGMPVVDLKYTRHRAIDFNETGNYYTFTNIRYAAPVIGDLRFRAPRAPETDRSVVEDGAQGRICPQAQPSWLKVSEKWIPDYLFGHPPNMTEAEISAINDTVTQTKIPAQVVDADEDCLFLDVTAPKSTFEAIRDSASAELAPVLVWIHGGGFTSGSKVEAGNPAGLLWTSQLQGRQPPVFVSINYRLGAFGWLAGAKFQSNGVANAGLLDQRLALEWVKQNIHLFGGDPNRVTVVAESAGATSVVHHITAYGGKAEALFQQAIIQSPAFLPQANDNILDEQYNNFLAAAEARDFDELRSKSSSMLISANTLLVSRSDFGKFTFGIAVDGDYVPALPSKLLAEGKFNKNVQLMIGQNSNEGLVFVHPRINDEEQFTSRFLPALLPKAKPDIIEYIAGTMYPPVFNGKHKYRDYVGRMSRVIADFIVLCNTFYIEKAFDNETYGYQFAPFPGIHHQDVAHTFYNYGKVNWGQLVFNTSAAVILQDWITTFTQDGKPSTPGYPVVPEFPLYGQNATLMKLDTGSLKLITDPAANERCNWWQQELWI